jgi:hypothetical protein
MASGERPAAVGTCEQCGAPVGAGDTFCGNCGAFLEWDGDADPAERADPAKRSDMAQRADPAERADMAQRADPAERADMDKRAEVPPDTPATAPDHADDLAADLAADQPGAVLPGRPVAPRLHVRRFEGEPPPAPDDVVCGQCGAPNPAQRRFCRRCGQPLADQQPAGKLPWWRRLLQWLRSRRGTRQRPRRRFPPLLELLLKVLVGAALLLALIYGASRVVPPAVDAARDRLTKPTPVNPVQVTASSEAPGHQAELATDGKSNRFWSPAPRTPAAGQHVEMAFARPFRLRHLIVHSGSSPRQDEFLRQARPADLDVRVVTSDQRVVHRRLRLEDRPGEQLIDWTVGDVARIRFTIASAYGTGRGKLVSLGEVEFFGRT